jgi:hypothetical protein
VTRAPVFDNPTTQTAAFAPAAPAAPVAAVTAPRPRGRGPALFAAAAVGVLLVVVGGAAFVLRGRLSGATPAPAPTVAASSSSSAAPAKTPPAPGQPIVVPPVEQGADSLIAAAQQAGRPAKEIAALSAGKARLTGLATQIKALNGAPDAAAKAAPLLDQLNAAAVETARGEAASLGRLALTQAREVDHTLGGAPHTEGSAEAVSAVHKAKAGMDAAAAPILRGADGAASLDAARQAVVAYANFTAAYTAATRFYAPAKRAAIAAEVSDVRDEGAQVVSMAAVAKPWIFAVTARKQAYQALQDNATRAKADLAQLDTITRGAADTSDLKALDADAARVAALKQSIEGLRASSTTAQAAAK